MEKRCYCLHCNEDWPMESREVKDFSLCLNKDCGKEGLVIFNENIPHKYYFIDQTVFQQFFEKASVSEQYRKIKEMEIAAQQEKEKRIQEYLESKSKEKL